MGNINKPDYIQFIEVQENVFSVMKFHDFDKEIIDYLDKKAFDRVYEVGVVSKSGKAKWSEVIYKTKQNFFIHLTSIDEDKESFSLTIYYKSEQRGELLIFTTKILKPFKDGANHNGAIETEN